MPARQAYSHWASVGRSNRPPGLPGEPVGEGPGVVVGDERHRVVVGLREAGGLPGELLALGEALAVEAVAARGPLLGLGPIPGLGDEPGELAAGDGGPAEVVGRG